MVATTSMALVVTCDTIDNLHKVSLVIKKTTMLPIMNMTLLASLITVRVSRVLDRQEKKRVNNMHFINANVLFLIDLT